MAEVDRVTARALVEVGYMPLTVYLERFAGVARPGRSMSSLPRPFLTRAKPRSRSCRPMPSR